MINSLYRVIRNRGVVMILGSVAFIATCFTLSPDSASPPQIWGYAIYALFGFLLFQTRGDLHRTILFFSPFTFWIVVSLTNNPGLVPDVVPLLIVTCIIGFYGGAFLAVMLFNKQKAGIAVPILLSALYLFVVIELIVPRIIFSRLNEPVPTTPLISQTQLTFVNHLQDSIVIKSKRISVIDFWFTKCGICYPNNDYLNIQAAKYKPLGVDFYLIYMGHIDSYEEFQASQKESRWKNLISLYDPHGHVSKMFNLEGAPHTLIVSGDKIVYHQTGFSKEAKSLEGKKINEIIMAEVHKNADLRTLVPGIKNTIDLGEIDDRYDSLQVFRFQNIFPDPLYIQEVKGSCNCMISNWTKDAITSNEYGEISFKLIPDGNTDDNKTLVIATSSAQSPFTIVDFSYKRQVH